MFKTNSAVLFSILFWIIRNLFFLFKKMLYSFKWHLTKIKKNISFGKNYERKYVNVNWWSLWTVWNWWCTWTVVFLSVYVQKRFDVIEFFSSFSSWGCITYSTSIFIVDVDTKKLVFKVKFSHCDDDDAVAVMAVLHCISAWICSEHKTLRVDVYEQEHTQRWAPRIGTNTRALAIAAIQQQCSVCARYYNPTECENWKLRSVYRMYRFRVCVIRSHCLRVYAYRNLCMYVHIIEKNTFKNWWAV